MTLCLRGTAGPAAGTVELDSAAEMLDSAEMLGSPSTDIWWRASSHLRQKWAKHVMHLVLAASSHLSHWYIGMCSMML